MVRYFASNGFLRLLNCATYIRSDVTLLLFISFIIDDFRLLDVPYPLIDSNPDWEGFFEWGKPWYTIDENDPAQNPWAVSNEPLLVPFDTQVNCSFHVHVVKWST